MKVSIGAPPDWIGPYQLGEIISPFTNHDRKAGHTATQKLLASHQWLHDLLTWIHTKRNRTHKVKIDSWDTWSMDWTLATIILPMLIQLKATKHGSPGDLPHFAQTSYGTVQHTFPFYGEDDDLAWDAGHREWNKILDEIIWSFDQCARFNPDEPGSDQYATIDEWRAAYREYNARLQRGFTLFGQYYSALWD